MTSADLSSATAIPVAVFHDYPLKTLNTFGLHAVAEKLSFITSIRELVWLHNHNLLDASVLVMGGGSNMLFLNPYLHRLVLVNQITGMEVLTSSDSEIVVRWGGGTNWHTVVMQAVEHGWGGIENLALIPGTIGAAPVQNIGAYGVELKEVFVECTAFHLETGQLMTFTKEDCAFGYRDSVFKGAYKDKLLITSVTLRLTPVAVHTPKVAYGAIKDVLAAKGVAVPTIQDVAEAVIEIRSSKLPDPAQIGNAGSFFKNPEIPEAEFKALQASYPDIPHYPAPAGLVKVPAGWLIEHAGLKGYRDGDAGVHAKQALVIVNHGNATGPELRAMAEKVMRTVKEKYGISLTPEVNWIQ